MATKAMVASLTRAEQDLIRETEPKRLAKLDADELGNVQDRVRKARNRHANQYRRDGAQAVKKSGGRGKARPANTRNADKVEVFEEALARVSLAYSKALSKSAAGLKSDRLDAKKSGKGSAKKKDDAKSKKGGAKKAGKKGGAKKAGKKGSGGKAANGRGAVNKRHDPTSKNERRGNRNTRRKSRQKLRAKR